MNVTTFSDPGKIGPGIWFSIHTTSLHATTDELKKSFIIFINALCDNFRCKTCQPHFRKFIDNHPLNDYWNIKDSKNRDIGFFKWSHIYHNEVNARLGKYQPTLEEAYAFYSNSEVGACFDCGNKLTNVSDQRSRAIPPILTLYRQSANLNPQPFKLISRTNL